MKKYNVYQLVDEESICTMCGAVICCCGEEAYFPTRRKEFLRHLTEEEVAATKEAAKLVGINIIVNPV